MRVRLPSPSLVTKVMLLSLVPIVVLGIGLARTVQHRIQARSLADARQSAFLLAHIAQPHLSQWDLRGAISAADQRVLDGALASGPVRQDIARFKVWNMSGTVVYSDDHRLTGRRFPPTDELRRALQGRVFSQVSTPNKAENVDERKLGKVLEVYTPLRLAGSPPTASPDGAFEIYVPYARVEAGIASDSRMIFYMLAIGLAVLWGILYRIVSRAARTLRRQAEENRHQAQHDALTGLPNRTLFQRRLERQVRVSEREFSTFSVLMIDLNRFKEINDTLGHSTGDRLLRDVGDRLLRALGPADTVARLSGDEFTLILPGADSDRAGDAATRIIKALDEPFSLADLAVSVDASIGIVTFPTHGYDAETLIQRADVAMYLAKDRGVDVAFYEAAADLHSPQRLALIAELRSAIAADELELHYQPKFAAADLRVAGVEALVRWRHPGRGLLAPGEFIALAERTSLIKPLTLLVLRKAARQCREWNEMGLDVSVAVNLSVANLLDLELVDDVARILEQEGLPAARLELEITEGMVMSDPERAIGQLSRLDAMGISLAIDDFGTGQSSLAYLRRLPVSELKIDRSFVRDVATDGDDAAIVRSTIDLAHSLGLRVVAEGVEDADALTTLQRLNCDYAQGFYLCRPAPAETLVTTLLALTKAQQHTGGAPQHSNGARPHGGGVPALSS